MKKLTYILLAFCFSLNGQDKKISQLVPIPSVNGTELIPVARGGANYYMTSTQLGTYISGSGLAHYQQILNPIGAPMTKRYQLGFNGGFNVLDDGTDNVTNVFIDSVWFKHRFIPRTGTISGYPLTGPIQFSTGTTALWQNSSTGSGYYVGFGDNSDLSVAGLASYSYYTSNGAQIVAADASSNAAGLLLNNTSGTLYSQDATSSQSFNFSSGTLNVATSKNTFPGITYGSTVAGYVTTNQTQYSLLHRAAGDARWASINSINGTTNYVPKFSSISTIGNSLIYDDGTTIGIGTTSPSGNGEKLNVNGSQYIGSGALGIGAFDGNYALATNNKIKINSGINIDDNAIGDFITFGNGGVGWRLEGTGNASQIGHRFNVHRFEDNNASEIMRMTSSSGLPLVGIGTVSPTEELHVIGSIRMVDGNQGSGKVLTSDANGVGVWQAISSDITATPPLSISTNTISISQSNTSTNGYLSSTDWNTFNNKASSSATFTINGTGMALGTSSTVTAAAGTLTGATLNSGVTSSSLTSFGVSPTFTTPTLGVASATSLAITGTAGNGFISLATQTSTPSAPSSGTVLFSNSNSKLSWRGSANNYVKTFDGAILTADRVYSLPNRNAMLDSLTTSTSTALNGYIKGNGSVLSATATIGATDGGTGQTSVTTGDLLYGSATNTWSKLGGASSGSYLRSAGTTTAPLWSTLKLPNSATLNYIPFASATNTWGESSSFQWDDANKFLYVRNTVASGLGGLIAIGNDNATTTLQLFCYGTTQAGNWTGTSIAYAGKAFMQAGGSAVGSYVNAATNVWNLIGTTGTNYGTYLNSAGLKIDQIQNLHTAAAYPLEVNGTAKFSGVLGTTTNDNASSGNVGQYVESLVAAGSAITFTTNTAMNITSISLTAGDWDVMGGVNYTETVATVSARTASIGTTSATLATDGSEGECGVQSTLITEKNSIDLPRKRISVSGTTTVYLVGRCVFSAGTASGYGFINARRVR